jgi:hypothetical protein
MNRTVSPSERHRAFYADALTALQRVIRDYPEIRNLEIIALFGQAAGTCIAMAYPDERDLARATAIENLDARLRELGAAMPTATSTRAQ